MDTWFSMSLGDAIYGDKGLETLGVHVQQAFARAGDPPDMAVFTRLESEGRLHCELVAYFSPAARQAAEIFETAACKRPVRTGLDLFAGDPAC